MIVGLVEEIARLEQSLPAPAPPKPRHVHAPEELRTFVVMGGTVSLCREHRCGWLEELYDSPALTKSDLSLITRETVLQARNARLV